MTKWVFTGIAHKTISDENKILTQDERLELAALNISTKHYDTKNDMLDAVIKRCEENKDKPEQSSLHCEECIKSAIQMFNAGYPGDKIIRDYAKYFHKNFPHKGFKND